MTLRCNMSAAIACGVAALFLVPRPLWAQGNDPIPDAAEGWSLHWQAAEGCPSEQAVQAEIRSLLAGSSHTGATLDITGATTIEGHGFAVELRFVGPSGSSHRSLRGATCLQLAKASALIIALAVDPGVRIDPNRASALEQPAIEPPKPTPSASPPSKPAPPEPPPPEPPPPKSEKKPAPTPTPLPQKPAQPLLVQQRRREWSIEILAAPAVQIGSLPTATFGASGGIAVDFRRARGTVQFDWLPARTYDTAFDTRLRSSLFMASISAGYALPLGRHSLTFEAGLQVGDWVARAQNAASPLETHTLAIGPQTGLRGALQLTENVGLWAGVSTGLQLQRPKFIVENRGQVYQPDALWLTARTGVFVRWP